MHPMLKYCFGLPDISYDADSVLITEGETGGPLFVLVEGCISVQRGDVEVARIDTPGAVIGEVSALLNVPHTATLRTLTNARVHVFEDAREFIESRPQIAVHVAELLASGSNLTLGTLFGLLR